MIELLAGVGAWISYLYHFSCDGKVHYQFHSFALVIVHLIMFPPFSNLDVRRSRWPLCYSPGWLLCGNPGLHSVWFCVGVVAEEEDRPTPELASFRVEGAAQALKTNTTVILLIIGATCLAV